jgi:phosphate-selective porin OprO and OprP
MNRNLGAFLVGHLVLLGWLVLEGSASRAGEPAPPFVPWAESAPVDPSTGKAGTGGEDRGPRPDAGPGAGKGKEEGKAEKESGDPFQSRFNLTEGLVGETSDKAFKYHVGGRFDWDSGWYRVPANIQQSLGSTPLLDGTDLRRFRLGVDGTVWKQVDFALEADFSKGGDFKSFQSTPQTNIFITNAWVAVHDLPVVDTVKAGHQKEYLSFDNGTGANYLPFMERPYIFDAYENDFSWDNGVSTNRTYFNESVTSWFGAFWNGTRSQAFNVGGHYAASGRLTWMPVYDEDAQQWLNLEVSGSVRALTNDPDSVTVRPLVRTGSSFQVPNLIDTGAILSNDGLQIAGAGVHSAWGPLSLGGQFLCWNVGNAFTGGLPGPNGVLPPGAQSVGNLFFSGFSLEALCFLTPGDHRPVDRVIPGYARVRPVRNFICTRDGDGCSCRGTGAWEVGVRYDHVDVNSGLIQAGVLDSVTLGVNWYLNPNTRLTANYVYTNRNTNSPSSSGNFDSFGVRVHFDF